MRLYCYILFCSLFASQGSLVLVPEGIWQNNNNIIIIYMLHTECDCKSYLSSFFPRNVHYFHVVQPSHLFMRLLHITFILFVIITVAEMESTLVIGCTCEHTTYCYMTIATVGNPLV